MITNYKNIYKNFFKKKKILITGGTGLIGMQLIELLKNFNCKIYVASLDKIKLPKKILHYRGNLTDNKFCEKITKNKDCVFHLAGIKGSVKTTLEKPASFFVPLLKMNTNILESSRTNKVKYLVYTSSIGAYQKASVFKEEKNNFNSEPMDFFPGWAKRIAELQIKSYKIQYKLKNYYVVRPCNVFGPYDNFDAENSMVIPTLIKKICSTKKKINIWGDGKAIRDFAFSRDVAEGIMQTMVHGTGKFDFLNLGSGKKITINKLVKTLNQIKKFKYKFDKTKNSGFAIRLMNISNAKKIIKYNPRTSLKEGLKITLKWYQKNKNNQRFRYNYFK